MKNLRKNDKQKLIAKNDITLETAHTHTPYFLIEKKIIKNLVQYLCLLIIQKLDGNSRSRDGPSFCGYLRRGGEIGRTQGPPLH